MHKKLSPKIVFLALLALSLLSSGGLAIKTAIAPSGGGATGGVGDEFDPSGG